MFGNESNIAVDFDLDIFTSVKYSVALHLYHILKLSLNFVWFYSLCWLILKHCYFDAQSIYTCEVFVSVSHWAC